MHDISIENIMRRQLRKKFKDITSIKFIEVIILEHIRNNKKEDFTQFIKMEINELEYVADVLIYGDIINPFLKDYSMYQITIGWIK